ncbi:MAG: pitrilysin family protein [bacterium]
MINCKKSTLPNRLRIIVSPMTSTEAVTVMILIRAGSRYEVQKIRGIAHFLEHMFFKGGQRYPDPRSVAEAIDGVGGVFNAFTWREYVGYFVKVAKDKIDIAFDVLSDMLMNAQFDKDALDRERGVILEEYNMYQDTPMLSIGDTFEGLLYGDHPIGWATIGLKPVIKSVSRTDFMRYRQKLYTPSNIVVSVAGNTSMSEVKKRVNKYLPFAKIGRKSQPLPYRAPAPAKKLKVVYKNTEQAHLILGVPTFGAQHRDRYTERVLAAVLGGGMSSRLFTSVRERLGLAYYVRAGVSHYVDAGYLLASAGVDVKRIDVAIKTIIGELRQLTAELVPAKELKKAKEYLLGGLVLGLEDSDDVAYGFGIEELLFGKVETIPETRRKIRAVTAQQVRALAQRIFTDKALALAVVGPYKENSAIKRAFKL